MMKHLPASSTRYWRTRGGRLQVSRSRHYRVAWMLLVLLLLPVWVFTVHRLPLPAAAPMLLLHWVLLALCYRVPQQDHIIRWRDRQWWLWQRGNWRQARLGRCVVLFPWLTLFTLHCDGSRHFLLFSDGAAQADLHKLRVQLALQVSEQG